MTNQSVSVVTTVYNDAEALMALLDEMDGQAFPLDEVIVVDGGSSDGTLALLDERKDSYRFRLKYLFDGKRRNISKGFNDAIRMARNEWILIVACGNSYDACFVKELARETERANDDCEVIYCTVTGKETSGFSRVYIDTFLGDKRPHDYRASNHGALIRRRVFEQFGGFHEGFAYAGEDTEFYERLRRNHVKMHWAQQARAVWDIPANLREYLKQLRIYTIADMQIYGLRYAWNKSLQILALFCLGILVCTHRAIGLGILLTLILAYTWKKRNPRPSSMVLLFATKLIRCFYCIRYLRYGFTEPVIRNAIRLPSQSFFPSAEVKQDGSLSRKPSDM